MRPAEPFPLPALSASPPTFPGPSMARICSSVSVEVKCQETFAYFCNCSLVDCNPTNGGHLLIEYENDWRPAEWIAISDVRFSPSFPSLVDWRPRVGEEVEVQARSSDAEPFSWWLAAIRADKGNSFLIAYSHWERENESFTAVMEKSALRPKNPHTSLNILSCLKEILPLPNPVALWSNFTLETIKRIRMSSGALSITLDPIARTITLIGSIQSVQNATAFIQVAFKQLLGQQSAQPGNLIAQGHQGGMGGWIEQFTCSPSLIGLVIGKRGKNVRLAEEINGVQSVKLDPDRGIIVIVAETQSQALEARSLLEFIEIRVEIPSPFIGRVVGKGFAFIREIEQLSGAQRIRVVDEEFPDKPKSALTQLAILGTRAAVEDARLCLELHLNYLKQIESLTQEEQKKHLTITELSRELAIKQRNKAASVYKEINRIATHERRDRKRAGKETGKPESAHQYAQAGAQENEQKAQESGRVVAETLNAIVDSLVSV